MSTFYIILAIIFAKSLADVLHEDKYVVKRKTTSAVGKYLKGHGFKITKEAIDPQHCVADCWAENDQCQSLNYFPSWDICELNEASNLTNPEDLIDRPDTVYLTNPIYGHRPKPEMARHTNYDPPDPCASNPCTNAESCVNDSHLGYRCQNCHSQYTGPKCEEHLDPCVSNPCRFGGTCISTMDRWRCVCLFPFQGRHCTDVTNAYYINLNGTGDYYPYSVRKAIRFQRFVLSFWFKTQQNVSYFIHKIPKKSSDPERLTVWHAGNTFFVELWKDHVYNFSFPFSYPVNDNNWHVVAIVLQKSAELFFYLDGARRDPPRLTIGVPDSMTLYYFRDSTVYIGYFKDTHDKEHFFNGSIGKVDIGETAPLYGTINSHFVRTCTRAGNFERMIWSNVIWTGLDRHAKKVDCSARVPIMGIKSHEFPSQAASQWLEQAVSPPRDLTAFTMFFQIQTSMFFDKAIQIACYGNRGDDCHLSVVINANFTLEIIIESTRFLVHLVPVNDHKAHYVAIKWTNDGGVFELIIDGILQSTKTGIEVNGKISGQSRFIVGSSVPDKRTLDGFINNLNVWDEIITDEMLYLMTLEPGNDVGNIVAWRDFTRPSSIAEEQFSISKRDVNFRVRIVGRNNIQLYFSKPFPAYISTTATCCYVRYGMALTMWLSLQALPANLLRLYMTAEDTNPRIALMISPNRNITLSLNGQIASLGSWPAAASGQYADRNYNYLALSWSNNGDLFFNLNGQETHVSSNFAARTNYRLVHAKSFWVIGERHNNGSGIVGSVAQLNLWVEAKPPPLLMAMSRGINGIGSYHLSWENWNDGSYQGNVEEVEGNLYYQPDFIVQKRRDQLCNDVLPPVCVGKYRARIGMFGRSGVRWGCFCDENLSEDMNFNYGSGNYTLHFDLTTIN